MRHNGAAKDIAREMAAACRRHWPAFFAALAVSLLYARVASFDFTNWDDDRFIVSNHHIRAFSQENLKTIATPGGIQGEQLYIPLFYMSLLVEKSLFGDSPAVCHVDNLLLHVLNVLLCYCLVFLVSGNRWTAGLTCCLFAFHPIQVETVAWCMGRKDLLMTFFVLLSLVLYWLYLRSGKSGASLPAASLLMFVLSLLSKPSSLPTPLIFILMELHKNGRLDRGAFFRLAPFFSAGLAALLVNMAIKANSLGQTFGALPLRLAFLPICVQGWLARIFLLSGTNPMYLWHAYVNSDDIVLLPALAMAVSAAAFFLACRRHRSSVCFWLLFSLTFFLPAIGQVLYFYRDIITADRYGYLALIGVFAACASLFSEVVSDRWRFVPRAVVAVWIPASMFFTNDALENWRNSKKLWTATLNRNPNNYMASYNLGNIFFREGDRARAEKLYRQSSIAFPEASTSYNLGVVCDLTGRPREAARHFMAAALMEPESLKFTKKATLICYRLGNYRSAARFCELSLRYHPEHVKSYYYAGEILKRLGKPERARRCFERFRRLKRMEARSGGK